MIAGSLPWALSALGLILLFLAGDSLVKGAVNLSLRLGVSVLIVSLTIVSFGTSAPELFVSIKAVLENTPGIALGNVVGSNTANILLVLGVPALVATIQISNCDAKQSYNYMIAVSLLFIALAFRGVFDWKSALILLIILVFMLTISIRKALVMRTFHNPSSKIENEADNHKIFFPVWKITLLLIFGMTGLPLGASLLVDNATIIARVYGVSDTVIGLTFVAVGTSLPELATTAVAALRRQAEMALGNVIGSNMFNILAVLGITSLVSPIPVAAEILHFDLWIMLGASVLLIPFVYMGRDITRIWGIILTGLYLLYLACLMAK